MPIYFCTVAEGWLTASQKAEIAKAITTIYNEETGSPRWLVQVFFNEIEPGNHFVAGELESADQIWVRCDTRSGKTDAEKSNMLKRILADVARICGTDEDWVSVLLCESPYTNITEVGRIAPEAGQEAVWLTTLPQALQDRLRALA